MRRALLMTALLAGTMMFGTMAANAGVIANVDLHFGRRAPVVYASGPVGYAPSPVVYVDANGRCGGERVRYGERIVCRAPRDVRWNASERWGRGRDQGAHQRRGDMRRGDGGSHRDFSSRDNGRWGGGN